MDEASQDRHSLFMLISLVVFFVLSAFLTERNVLGEGILLLSMYVTLVAGTLQLSQEKAWRWPGLLLAACSMLTMLIHFLRPGHSILVAGWVFLAVFFGFISVALFSYLGRPGSITSGRLYASVSLYVILGIFFYTLFNLVELIYPGSFQESGLGPAGSVTRHALLYLSLVTLTTLGYGDITPVSPPARMLAAFEAVVGILYIAITVARLVAAYQSANRK
jgi:hypothetical protein